MNILKTALVSLMICIVAKMSDLHENLQISANTILKPHINKGIPMYMHEEK